MHTAISKTLTFDAAHSLPHHEGKCQRVHGHTYRLTVTLIGHVRPVEPGDVREPVVITAGAEEWQPSQYGLSDIERTVNSDPVHPPNRATLPYRSDVGMVYDFGDLTAAMRSLTDMLDHQYINDVVPDVYPTAENLCFWFYQGLRLIIPDPIEIASVIVAETPTSYAELTSEMYGRR